MSLSFRHRLFLTMVALGTLPLAVALVALALHVRSASSPTGARAALDEIAASGAALVTTIDTTALGADAAGAIRAHTETIARRTTLARRADTLSRYAAGALGAAVFVLAALFVAASLWFARRWSRYVSAPIEQLVDWVRRIERGDPLPTNTESGGAPEFDDLRGALSEMAQALEAARVRELERAKLTAFRETARRVAHEMRGPLSATRFALRALGVSERDSAARVIEEETTRLEQMALTFSEFGRLPEGPAADIDVPEMIASVVTASVPTGLPVHVTATAGLTVRGHYEPLRRAIQNLLRNAIEVTDRRGIDITARHGDGAVTLTVTDHGPGVPIDLRDRVFDPYFTTKAEGTGLGLALVHQTVVAHDGNITIEDTPGGGSSFVITLPDRT